MTLASSSPTPRQTLWIEPGEVRIGPVARVAMLTPVEKPYTFTVPDELADQVEPGKRLLVPFGRKARPSPAFCLAIAREPWTSTLKPVTGVLDEQRLLSDPLIELGQWMSHYYGCPLGRTLTAMVPQPIRKRSGFRTVHVCHLVRDDATHPTVAIRSRKRQSVVEILSAHPGGLELNALLAESGASKGIIAAMHKNKQIEIRTHREPQPAPDFDRPSEEPAFALNGAQRAAIDRIVTLAGAGGFRVLLLFGVSGSGKTEVYIRAMRAVLAAGRQVILLVPEIALTTQVVDRLASRFQDVAVIHSGLTGVQRSLTWSAIARGVKRVVIGTRSAIFAPCPDLGLIVVDEEQEGSYKNLQSPRFHTRDVAIKRAQLASIPIVLGSATPSLETWHNCDRYAHFERITLPARISGFPMPAVTFVDMRFAQQQRKGFHLLSEVMERQLGETLDAGQQAVLLLNRRGYASYLVCNRCQQAIVCPNCRVNMVFHQTTGQALCHYCQAKMAVPARCMDSSCGGTLARWGMGTQRVEEELRKKFPSARVARADSDTMTRPDAYERLLSAFTNRETDILLGTQMIAKGLDFPAVAFVGVVNADTALAIPDFRAAERTFQLVTQVAGRAGRAGTGGRGVVQSMAGPSPALRSAMNHDYLAFAQHELPIRRRLNWPPFSRLARVVVSHASGQQAQREVTALADRIRRYLADHSIPADVLGPQTAPLSRLRNMYRYDFLIRTASANKLMEILSSLRNEGVLKPSSRHILVDVDPTSLL